MLTMTMSCWPSPTRLDPRRSVDRPSRPWDCRPPPSLLPGRRGRMVPAASIPSTALHRSASPSSLRRMRVFAGVSPRIAPPGVSESNWLLTNQRRLAMTQKGSTMLALLLVVVVPVLALSAGTASAQCTGPGAPTTTQTKCLTAVQIPGNPLRSFDISWVDPDRAEYYLADRSNKGIDIVDTEHNTFKRTILGFVGIKLLGTGAVDNNHSGPDGVVSHSRWLYAGDGDSTLKVIDLNAPTTSAIKQTISTGGTTRVDEMALTTDGKLLLVANNAEDPPFGTLFKANGDANTSAVSKITKITVDS